MTPKENQLTEEILERVRELVAERQAAEPPFVPGESPVRYAGRVYGAEEVVNLVESSLEFWLTAGRWAKRLEKELAAWYGLRRASVGNSGARANLVGFSALSRKRVGD